ncbi:MAG: hypothetical protein GEV28_15605 [Actinophytocola sp.]|uniref:hypothetical protein n=1 Tax=Actinophytocola sp. TaxID=1872138 RepID=UPI00132C7C75|nr:hypothetical protein [Actinophytocola sp.]MPZ81745.1 hypothetical protein [Actinophytocola sp.]
MSPSGPYQGEPGRQDPYGRQHPPRQYPQQYQQRQPSGDPYQDSYQDAHQDPGYQQQPQYGQPGPPPRPPAARRPEPPPEYPDDGGFKFRVPGLGLVLSLLGIVVQILCMLVLPWVSAAAAGGESISLPELWDLASDAGAQGFGGWYLVLFSYPLAALGIVLALVSVLESVAGKMIFAGLAIVGIGWLLLRYGVGPAAGLFGEDAGLDFSRQEITTIVIAVAALILVIFMLKTGLAMFRRIAGLVLLVIAGVHVYAVQDLGGGDDGLSFGAYGPALGYVLSGVAALVGPRRLTPG